MKNRVEFLERDLAARRPPLHAVLGLAVGLALACSAPGWSQAQTYSVLYSFQCTPDGRYPLDPLVLDAAGNLYGTTSFGGASNFGTVFALSPSGTETILYSFTGGLDGKYPEGALLRDAAGNFISTTSSGGAFGHGVVFKLTPGGQETTLHSFAGRLTDGDTPLAGLTRDKAGNLYGTTGNGGNYNLGTVFELPVGGHEKLLHSFAPFGGDAQIANSALVLDAAGNLYGSSRQGGSFNAGAVYKIDPTGAESVLFSFDASDGKTPVGGVTLDASGNLYGTTIFDGGHVCGPGVNCGLVYSLSSTGQETLLHSFSGPPKDGAYPSATLLRSPLGTLFGTTGGGGSGPCIGGCGVAFSLNPAGEETILHAFTGYPGDGAGPDSGVTADKAGNLYGTTAAGGSTLGPDGQGCGTVYKITP
ncbi:MAG TPA: choice-of-anchor tandem repeat GloVer-containing protein [Terriglobia bacterium]|nr:choice-of-anchor tandem repeat GloVer-containing protein [Terriglobia bacterium]